jgi:AraC-like DNA-binding protein
MTPGDWITDQQISRAKDLLERSSLSMDQVAARSGMGTAMTMRHHFRKRIGLSPVECRIRFSRLGAARTAIAGVRIVRLGRRYVKRSREVLKHWALDRLIESKAHLSFGKLEAPLIGYDRTA